MAVPSKADFIATGLAPVTVTRKHECHICYLRFFDPEDTKLAARLPCGHVFGEKCIIEWLDHHNTCPMCRHTLLEQRTQRPIDGSTRRGLITGGTLGLRVVRLLGPGTVLEQIAQDIAEREQPEDVWAKWRRMCRRERSFVRDKEVMDAAREDPVLWSWRRRNHVLLALSLAEDGIGTDGEWYVLTAHPMEENAVLREA